MTPKPQPTTRPEVSRSRRALFLDRDGVINVDHGYVHRIDDFEFMPGILDLCRAAHERGFLLVVVTNQAGIARGRYTEADFAHLTAWMQERFAEAGAPLTQVYHCPVHPTAGIGALRTESDHRKPAPGMLLRAASEHGIDLGRSILVGDKASDIEAGLAAGVPVNLWFRSGADAGATPAGATARIDQLAQALRWLSPA